MFFDGVFDNMDGMTYIPVGQLPLASSMNSILKYVQFPLSCLWWL